MKKYMCLILILLSISSNKVFAQFEIGIKGLFASTTSFTYGKLNEGERPGGGTIIDLGAINSFNGDVGTFSYSAGAMLEIGYNFNINHNTLTGVSLLLDVGYYMQTFSSETNFDNTKFGLHKQKLIFHTLNLGALHKLNMNANNVLPISIGFGYGIKIPFSGNRTNINSGSILTEQTYSYKDIQNTFANDFISYIKLTTDIYFYVSKKQAITVGAYLSYNFGLNYFLNKTLANGNIVPYENGYSAIDIGVSVGYYFGRENPRGQ